MFKLGSINVIRMYVTWTGALYMIFSICQRTIVTVVSAAEPEPKLRIAAPASLYLSDLKKFYGKNHAY